MHPQARTTELIVQHLADETVIYDLARAHAHALNPSAALVWRHADGATSIPQLAALLQTELGGPADERLVWLALQRLGEAHLLETPGAGHAVTRISRRELARQLQLVGGLAVLVPAVMSVVVPEPAAAASFIPQANCGAGTVGSCCDNFRRCQQTGATFACDGAACAG